MHAIKLVNIYTERKLVVAFKTILNIDNLNIRGMTSEIHEVNKHLKKITMLVFFGLVETFF